MKHKLFFVIFLLVTALLACKPVTTPTAPLPTPTDTPEPVLTPMPIPSTESLVEPGGIEVALTLVVIPDQETIARVNEEEISTVFYQEELELALYSVTSQYVLDWNDPANRSLLPSFQEQVLDQIIDSVLMRQLAIEAGITVDPEEIEAEVAMIKDQMEADPSIADWDAFLAENNLTEEDARKLIADDILVAALVEQHGGSSLVEQVQASHILVETEEIGQEVLDKLDAGEDFGALAAEYSTDPGSKDQGGDLGWFPRGMMVPEFEQAAFSLEPGETSGLVQTDFGYHIIRVYDKGEQEMDPGLFAQTQQQQFQTWFETQHTKASIERLYIFEGVE